jgi:hypothetical protein
MALSGQEIKGIRPIVYEQGEQYGEAEQAQPFLNHHGALPAVVPVPVRALVVGPRRTAGRSGSAIDARRGNASAAHTRARHTAAPVRRPSLPGRPRAGPRHSGTRRGAGAGASASASATRAHGRARGAGQVVRSRRRDSQPLGLGSGQGRPWSSSSPVGRASSTHCM